MKRFSKKRRWSASVAVEEWARQNLFVNISIDLSAKQRCGFMRSLGWLIPRFRLICTQFILIPRESASRRNYYSSFTLLSIMMPV